MRLRKQAIKTEFNQQTQFNARFRLLDKQKTDAEQAKKIWAQSQKQIADRHLSKKFFTRFSSETDCETLTDKAKRIKKLNDLVEWCPEIKESVNQQFGQNIQKVRLNKFQLQERRETKFRDAQSAVGHKRAGTQQTQFLRSSRTKKSAVSAATILDELQRSKYERCCVKVDEIYKKIAMLIEIGYSELKINGWIINFCSQRRPIVRECLMAKVTKTFFEHQQQMQYQKQSSIVKKKILRMMKKHKEFQNSIQVEDLHELAHYLQQIFIQKNSLKVKDLQETILDRMTFEKVPQSKKQSFVFTKKQSTEVQNFIHDLVIQEDKYGSFPVFTKVNKLRFQQLNRVEKNLKGVYQELVQTEARRLIKSNRVL